MSYNSNAEIAKAIAAAKQWLSVEGTARPSAVVRQMIKESRGHGIRMDIALAAYGLLLVGVEPNAGDIAWLVRDASIGFPAEPSFDFLTL